MMCPKNHVTNPYTNAAPKGTPPAVPLKIAGTNSRIGTNQPANEIPVQAATKKISIYLVILMRILRKFHGSLSSFNRLLRSPSTKWSIHSITSV